MNNSAVGFSLVPLQKQTETVPQPKRQGDDVKIFNLLQQNSYMRCQYQVRVSKQEKEWKGCQHKLATNKLENP